MEEKGLLEEAAIVEYEMQNINQLLLLHARCHLISVCDRPISYKTAPANREA